MKIPFLYYSERILLCNNAWLHFMGCQQPLDHHLKIDPVWIVSRRGCVCACMCVRA